MYTYEDGIGVLTKPRSKITNTASIGGILLRNTAQTDGIQNTIDGSIRLHFLEKVSIFKGPQQLLWAGRRAARAKIKRSGTPNRSVE
jgi:hypothetical protein